MTVFLDKDVLLSESAIWQQQCDFYAKEGVSAWYNQVPFYATSNSFISKVYAEAINAFMYDWQREHGAENFKIIELGAGCGQFSYLCMQNLQRFSFGAGYHWHYVMSDFDRQMLDFWSKHQALSQLQEQGVVSFVQGRIGGSLDDVLKQLNEAEAPVILIANYLFDSLPADIYKIGNESVQAVTVTISTEEDNINDGHVIDFEKVSMAYQPQAPELFDDDILEQYRLELFDSNIVYPTHGLKLLQQLNDASTYGLLLLACDKAYGNVEELDYCDYPELTGHNGCFSMMANFDALRRFAQLNKGDAFLPSTRPGIKTAAFGIGFHTAAMPTLQACMENYLESFSASDYLNLYRNMQKRKDEFNLEECVSFLALSNWDATVFQRLYERIFEQLNNADMLTINYLCEHLPLVAEHYYWLKVGQDLLFQIAIIYHTLQRYEDALKYYELSLSYFPAVFGLFFNMGICHFHLHQHQLAREYFEKAQALDPSDKKTKEWLAKL